MSDNKNIYYIYAWYYIDTNEIFYIGKGKNNRYCDTIHSRNKYFKNIISTSNVAVKFLYTDLTNEESLKIEKQLIKEYWKRGECKANFHEGGCGGNTGNYKNPERSKKLSEAGKKRVGVLNSNYGNKWSKEQREHLSKLNKGKNNMTAEHLNKIILANTGRVVKKETREKLSKIKKGTKQSPTAIYKMVVGHITNKYKIIYNDKLVFESFIKAEIYKYFKDTYNISRTIVDKIINNTYYPKFNKYMFLQNISIIISNVTKEEKDMLYNKGVSTSPDECKGVE